MKSIIQSNLLSPAQAAEYLQVKVATLAVWRSNGRYNLSYVKIGSRVQYRLSDLDAFIAERTHLHTGC